MDVCVCDCKFSLIMIGSRPCATETGVVISACADAESDLHTLPVFSPRSRNGGRLGTRNRAPHDLGRREDNPDLGHRSGNESAGNICMLVPVTFSLPEHPTHRASYPCTAKASETCL